MGAAVTPSRKLDLSNCFSGTIHAPCSPLRSACARNAPAKFARGGRCALPVPLLCILNETTQRPFQAIPQRVP